MGFIGSHTVALVTGGSRGLGLAAARGIGLRGARVIVLGRDVSRVNAAAAQLVDDGVEAAPVVADVADPASLARAAQEVAHVGPPDVLVLSAGVMSAKMTRTMRTSPDDGQRVMSINLDGGFYIKPTILSGTNDMQIFQEEIFGPVTGVTTFKTEEEAIAIRGWPERLLLCLLYTSDAADE